MIAGTQQKVRFMACKTETTEIDENEFSVTQWPAEKAMVMQLKLAKILGSSIAILGTLKDEDAQSEGDVLSGVIRALFEQATPEEISEIIKDCIVLNVAHEGRKIDSTQYKHLFSGDGLLMAYKVFFFVMKVNYAGFMRGPILEGTKVLMDRANKSK